MNNKTEITKRHWRQYRAQSSSFSRLKSNHSTLGYYQYDYINVSYMPR